MADFTVEAADALEWTARQIAAGARYPLVIVDPPFNFGIDYGEGSDDRLSLPAYRARCRTWLYRVPDLLTPHGTFCVFAPDEHVAHFAVTCEDAGLHLRSWIVWHYTFGVNCTKKFGRSHTHILAFSKHGSKFAFNAPAVAVPSSRQTTYGDARANPAGRTPQDTWVLRPQESPEHFSPGSDTWHVPRLVGNARERTGAHACQMPTEVASRLVAAYSNPGDTVLDFFAGTSTTGVAAIQLGRNFVGVEKNPQYVQLAIARLQSASIGGL